MAIDPKKQEQIDNLSMIAPELGKLAKDFVKRDGESKELDSAGRKFTALATPDGIKEKITKSITLVKIDAELKDPRTLAQVKDLLNRNPAGFEKVLPQIFENPSSTAALIQQQLALAPAAPKAAAPTQTTAAVQAPPKTGSPAQTTPPAAPATTERPAAGNAPLTTAAVATAAPSPAPAASTGATPAVQTPPAPSSPQESGGMAGFLLFLDKQKEKNPNIIQDFATFQQKMESNQIPAVSDAFRALSAEKGSSAESNAALDELKKTVETQPQFFANINKTMDKNPGALTGIANDAMAFGGGPAAVLKGVAGYSQFAQSNFAQDGFGKMILQFLDGFFGKGGLGGMINGLLGKAGINFKLGTDGKDVHRQSNNNGAVSNQLLSEQGSKPKTVTTMGANGDKQEQTGQQLTDGAPARDAQTNRALKDIGWSAPGGV